MFFCPSCLDAEDWPILLALFTAFGVSSFSSFSGGPLRLGSSSRDWSPPPNPRTVSPGGEVGQSVCDARPDVLALPDGWPLRLGSSSRDWSPLPNPRTVSPGREVGPPVCDVRPDVLALPSN